MCIQAGAPTPIQKNKTYTRNLKMRFSKAIFICFAFNYISIYSSILTIIVLQLQIIYQNKDVSFFRHFTREVLGS